MKSILFVTAVLMFAVPAWAANVTIEVNDISDYFVGECNSTGRGFGIFLDKVTGVKINGTNWRCYRLRQSRM